MLREFRSDTGILFVLRHHFATLPAATLVNAVDEYLYALYVPGINNA